MNWFKGIGIVLMIGGVARLGKASAFAGVTKISRISSILLVLLASLIGVVRSGFPENSGRRI